MLRCTKIKQSKVFSFYSYLIILWVSLCTFSTIYAEYPSQLQLAFKYGHHRSVGRGHILIPVWQQPHQLLFTHIIGLWDKDHNQESNIGLGYRQQKQDYMIGIYGYYDHRYSTYHHHFHQITLGLEYLTSHFEARLNGYWPFHAKHLLKRQGISLPKFVGAHYQRARYNQQTFEYALGGLDTELGFKSPKLPLYLYGGYYYFKRQGLAPLHGPCLRMHIPLAAVLSLSAECHYDRPRGLNYLLGFELNATLSTKRSPLGLAKKMTQSPIRDIDIIIQAGEKTIAIDTQTAIPIESYVDLDKIRENLSGHYIVTKDIVAVGQKHSPIGSEGTPFTGIIVGVSDDRSQLQQREIRGLILEGNRAKFGLWGYINFGLFGDVGHACIGYLSIAHQSFHLAHDEQHHNNQHAIGALAGGAYTHNIFIHNRNLSHLAGTEAFLGGLVGHAVSDNTFIHNINYGTLIAQGRGNLVGGIVGISYEDNIWTHNLNAGAITLHTMELSTSSIDNYAGGIVASAGTNDTLIYNTNAGPIQAIGDRGSRIGGIAGSIRASNVCTHNVNVALLRGTQLGGIVSKACHQNTVSYNFNAGPLMGDHSESIIGGILGSAEEDNIMIYNANSGNIIGENPTIGGIVARGYKDNIIAYNVNKGEISADKKDFFSAIGGIVAEISEHNTVDHNINVGAILVGSYGEAESDSDYPELERSVCIGGIVKSLRDSYISDGGYYKPPVHNTIVHNIQAGVITVGEQYAENYVGGIIRQHPDFSGNHFAHNIYNSALISHTPMTDQQLQSKPKTHLGSDNSFIDVTDFSTLPNGYFGLAEDWLLTTKGPMLTWLMKDRALTLLYYFNHLKVVHADHYLPLEMMLAIAGALDDFSYLSIAHIQKIHHYAFASVHDLVHHLSQPKCNWSKDNYLTYVLQ